MWISLFLKYSSRIKYSLVNKQQLKVVSNFKNASNYNYIIDYEPFASFRLLAIRACHYSPAITPYLYLLRCVTDLCWLVNQVTFILILWLYWVWIAVSKNNWIIFTLTSLHFECPQRIISAVKIFMDWDCNLH